jgi:hypothetical protein
VASFLTIGVLWLQHSAIAGSLGIAPTAGVISYLASAIARGLPTNTVRRALRRT